MNETILPLHKNTGKFLFILALIKEKRYYNDNNIFNYFRCNFNGEDPGEKGASCARQEYFSRSSPQSPFSALPRLGVTTTRPLRCDPPSSQGMSALPKCFPPRLIALPCVRCSRFPLLPRLQYILKLPRTRRLLLHIRLPLLWPTPLHRLLCTSRRSPSRLCWRALRFPNLSPHASPALSIASLLNVRLPRS